LRYGFGDLVQNFELGRVGGASNGYPLAPLETLDMWCKWNSIQIIEARAPRPDHLWHICSSSCTGEICKHGSLQYDVTVGLKFPWFHIGTVQWSSHYEIWHNIHDFLRALYICCVLYSDILPTLLGTFAFSTGNLKISLMSNIL